MKKILLFSGFLVLMDLTASAQVKVGILAGPSFATFKANGSGDAFTSSLGPGNLFSGFGPYVAMSIFGKIKKRNTGRDTSRDIRFGSDKTDDMKPFDYGANFIVGYELSKGFMINVNYNLGLADLSASGSGNSSWKL